jgi:phosphoserine phosphatase RsbX
MRIRTPIASPLIAWGVASRAKPGQDISGDLHLIASNPDGVLLAVVDGLGHGAEARAAARIALEVVEREAGAPLDTLFSRCHEGLIRTRGVAMTLASLRFSEEQLTWLGVGNVEALLLPGSRASAAAAKWVRLRESRAPDTVSELARAIAERALLRGGIVGYRLPELRLRRRPIMRGDLLIFATDGIRPDFLEGLERSDSPQGLAESIMQRHFKGTDDALVLVVRYLGIRHE